MKQRWINTRMKMLHKITDTKKAGSSTRAIIEKFMSSIQPEYPKKITVNYERPGIAGGAIPMHMDPIPLG
jgi:hypothetical protein